MEETMSYSKLWEARSAPPTTLAMHRDSHMISKPQPKVRIVHIFAPEIIKTDVANFRELVQRLTGKPSRRRGSGTGEKTKAGSRLRNKSDAPPPCIDVKVTRYRNSGSGERVMGEQEEIGSWMGDSNSGGLGDLDGFVQGLSSSHMDSFGATPVFQ